MESTQILFKIGEFRIFVSVFQKLAFPTSRVVVESGMRLSALSRILESVHLSLDLYGKVPDLTICDAIAAGNTASILGTGTD